MISIKINKISKSFSIKSNTSKKRIPILNQQKIETKTVLKDISFYVKKGEIIGIIGKNGSGKSTLLGIIGKIYQADSGTIETEGRIISILGLANGLKDHLSMKDNIYMCGSFFNLSLEEINSIIPKIVEFSELEGYLDKYLYQFSLGMQVRLIVAMGVYMSPDILLLDEVTDHADKWFVEKTSKKFLELAKTGTTIIIVSHDMWAINPCSRVIWLDNGEINMLDEKNKVLRAYASKP